MFFIIIFCLTSDQVKWMVIIVCTINLQWNQVLQILHIWNKKKCTKVRVSYLFIFNVKVLLLALPRGYIFACAYLFVCLFVNKKNLKGTESIIL